jgi:hypothetical protein
MAEEEQQLVPEGAPPSPAYADAFVARQGPGVITLYLMRVPPIFTEEQSRAVFGGRELHAPVVASVTVPDEIAEKLAVAIQNFLKDKSSKG